MPGLAHGERLIAKETYHKGYEEQLAERTEETPPENLFESPSAEDEIHPLAASDPIGARRQMAVSIFGWIGWLVAVIAAVAYWMS